MGFDTQVKLAIYAVDAGGHRERNGRHRVPPLATPEGVRQLKELGLTESLEVGYRLSPRGRALLRQNPEAPCS